MDRLADLLRPQEFEDILGQEHICNILKGQVKSGYLSNMVFFGPPGAGKTTIATMIAKKLNKEFYKINASNSALEDIRNVIKQTDYIQNRDGIILLIDEVHLFNKRQQQSLLSYMEEGSITLICATSENPYFTLHKALVSRSLVFEFKQIKNQEIQKGIYDGIKKIENKFNININVENEAVKLISAMSGGGDMRQAINVLEACLYCKGFKSEKNIKISIDDVKSLSVNQSFNFDEDIHYDLLSALQKSIRGSNIDASLYYMGRLLVRGDLQSICRRLLIISAEDIGMAYPQVFSIVKDVVDSTLIIGMPECRIPLAMATILLASSPKSNSACMSIDEVMKDIENGEIYNIPSHLKNSHHERSKALDKGEQYLYPHNFKNSYVNQEYLPENLKNKKYYIPKDNKYEKNLKKYLDFLKDESEKKT